MSGGRTSVHLRTNPVDEFIARLRGQRRGRPPKLVVDHLKLSADFQIRSLYMATKAARIEMGERIGYRAGPSGGDWEYTERAVRRAIKQSEVFIQQVLDCNWIIRWIDTSDKRSWIVVYGQGFDPSKAATYRYGIADPRSVFTMRSPRPWYVVYNLGRMEPTANPSNRAEVGQKVFDFEVFESSPFKFPVELVEQR